jgi:hypothetical protein
VEYLKRCRYWPRLSQTFALNKILGARFLLTGLEWVWNPYFAIVPPLEQDGLAVVVRFRQVLIGVKLLANPGDDFQYYSHPSLSHIHDATSWTMLPILPGDHLSLILQFDLPIPFSVSTKAQPH